MEYNMLNNAQKKKLYDSIEKELETTYNKIKNMIESSGLTEHEDYHIDESEYDTSESDDYLFKIFSDVAKDIDECIINEW